jgi:hypothetical protein
MQYLLLLTYDTTLAPPADDVPAAERLDGVFDDWTAYTRALHEAGVLVAGAPLEGVDAATTVRVREGRRLVSDGPFAETTEQIVGYYVIDVADLDAALGWAAKVPNVRWGSVEVRPLPPGPSIAESLLLATRA